MVKITKESFPLLVLSSIHHRKSKDGEPHTIQCSERGFFTKEQKKVEKGRDRGRGWRPDSSKASGANFGFGLCSCDVSNENI